MKLPRLVVLERDGRLTEALRPTVEARRWALRTPRQTGTCQRELEEDTPTVFVLHVGIKVEQELGLLERLHGRAGLRTVVVGDIANEPLAELAWDLGAAFVLFPPLSRELLPGVVTGLMGGMIAPPPTHEQEAIAATNRELTALAMTRPKKERGR